MYRCFTISAIMHGALILGLLILSLFSPPHRPQRPIAYINLNNRGIPGLKEGNPNPPGYAAPEQSPEAKTPEKKNEEPAQTPAPTAKPAPTPANTPAPKATPAPPQPPVKKSIVQPKKTPAPKTDVPVKKAPPTLKKPTPAKKVVSASKKIIVPKKDRKEQKLWEKPTPTPTPEPTPEETAPESVVADVTDKDQPSVPAEPQVAEFDAPVPSVPPVPAAPAPTVTPTGPGGKGTGQYKSSGGSLSASIAGPGTGTPGGQGGGSGGDGPGYGYGTILNSMAQTYFVIVLQRIEENFKLPYSRPGLECVVQFMIQKNGTITDIKIVKPTNTENLDRLAVQALEMTKLPPLYDGMQVNALPVLITFTYEKKL